MKRLLSLLLLSGCGSTAPPGKTVDELVSTFSVETGHGSLSIPQEGLSDSQLTGLLSDSRTPDLWSIELSGNAIGKEGLSALLSSEKTRQLKWLNLSDNQLDDAAIQTLANSERLNSVEHLLLANNAITGAGIQALAASPHLAKLRVLSLGNQPIGDTGAKALAQLTELESLNLESTGISGRGASALLHKLDAKTLTLRDNPLNEGLFDFPAFSDKLKTVDLRRCGLKPQQIQALGRAELGKGLELLHLDENPFGDAGIQALGDATWIGDLKKLTVKGSGASLEVRKGLREFWGKRGGMTIELR